jgi:Flp pilus assembly protein TadG
MPISRTNKALTHSRRLKQRGTVMLLTVLVLIALLGMMALAIDLGYVLSARTQVQNAMDAAALAGAVNLRTTIEPGIYPAPERDRLVRDAAKRFAAFNSVGVSNSAETNKVVLPDGGIEISAVAGVDETQQVRVSVSKGVPLFFAELFGFPTMNVSAASIASTVPVDGGTGGLGQCWRPLLLPDTFFDSANNVHWIGDSNRPDLPKLDQGDYYRSRFAIGGRNALPFVDTRAGDGGWVTGLRDAQVTDDLTQNKTVMGTTVRFSLAGYFIANFTSLPRTTFDVLPLVLQASRGFCGRVRVGDEVSVYSPSDAAAYSNVAQGLQQVLLENTDTPDATAKAIYRYIVTQDYAANTHPRIIPVLFFNPLELLNRNSVTRLKVTNIGLFYLESVDATGENLTGFFVRETIAEGSPVETANLSSDSFPRFRRSWLPTAPRLIR